MTSGVPMLVTDGTLNRKKLTVGPDRKLIASLEVASEYGDRRNRGVEMANGRVC